MAENTKIEWAHHTFNPWIGCTRVGPGCDHCYAAVLATTRLGVEWGAGAPRRRTAPSTWNQPLRWNARAARLSIRYRVFCASLADVFDNEVPPLWRAELFALIRETPNLDWLLVTKRVGNAERLAEAAGGWPRNVWLGATIVNQVEADRDIPKLLAIDGPRYRFLSMEPLLGAVDLRKNLGGTLWIGGQRGCAGSPERSGAMHHGYGSPDCPRRLHHHHDDRCRRGLDWIIVGGESGSDARPMHPDWARSLRDQCTHAGVPFLFKQWGEWHPWGQQLADGAFNLVSFGEDPRRFRHLSDETIISRVGKRGAGRLLDGAQHDGVPA